MADVRARRYTARERYGAKDMAAFCGVTLDVFYRTRLDRQARGMPAPYSSNPLSWLCERVDAWRAGRVMPQAANDTAPVADKTVAQHRDDLAREYGARH